ncbi:MAG: hypothetical protein HOW73_40700 [Polyangiaceae bacterium]|nr:hypothetical protein [Polyangiaceae bacterium]
MARIEPLVLFALSSLVACNAVFGLDEGQLADGGAGGNGGTNADGGANAGGGMSTSSLGGSPTTTTTMQGGGGGTGGGDPCELETGLKNDTFVYWSGSDPDDWQRFEYNAQLGISTISGLTDGLSIGMSDVGSGAYGGLSQTGAFIDWNQCVRLSGDAKRSTGTGRFRATATFEGEKLELELPSSGEFESFEATCRPTVPLRSFLFKLTVDQVPQNGTVTVQSHGVHFDHVCCDVDTPACPAE